MLLVAAKAGIENGDFDAASAIAGGLPAIHADAREAFDALKDWVGIRWMAAAVRSRVAGEQRREQSEDRYNGEAAQPTTACRPGSFRDPRCPHEIPVLVR